MGFLQAAANRGSLASGYNINNSLKFEQGNNEWLYRASPTAGDSQKHTFSFWIKRTTLGNPTASGTMYVMGQGQYGEMYFSSDFLQYQFDNGHTVRDVTTLHRDPAAWIHVVIAVDTTQGTAANRVKQYINGVQKTIFDHDGGGYPDQNDNASGWFTTSYLTIGTAPKGGSYNAGDGDYDMSGYLAEVAGVEGTQYAATDFGEYNDEGIWVPKDLGGITWGNEGFYLPFSNASNLGEDASGNDNDFALNNISAADQSTDTPTNNFAVINPLFKYPGSQLIKEGATQVTRSSGSGLNKTFLSTIGVSGGKWYAEFKPIAGSNYVVGIIPDSTSSSVAFDGNYIGNSAFPSSIGYYSDTGQKIVAPNGGSDYGGSYTTNDIISIALDMDNYRVQFAKNGTWQALSAYIDLTLDETTFIAFSYDSSGSMQCNFGGYHANSLSSAASDANGYGSFEYAPPSGYYALCTKNLASEGG